MITQPCGIMFRHFVAAIDVGVGMIPAYPIVNSYLHADYTRPSTLFIIKIRVPNTKLTRRHFALFC